MKNRVFILGLTAIVMATTVIVGCEPQAKGPEEEPEAASEPYVIPAAAPDWAPVREYIDQYKAWSELDLEIKESDASTEEKQRRAKEERGPRPKIGAAVAAAAAIVRLDGTHAKSREAAVFLVEVASHRGAAGEIEAVLLGIDALLTRHSDYDAWPTALDRLVDADGADTHTAVDAVFERLIRESPDPVAVASARYYAAQRELERANAEETPAAERRGHRERGIQFATGLAAGLESVAAPGWIPFSTFRDVEEALLYNLNHLFVGGKIPDVSGRRLDGVEESIGDFAGKVVLLDFWATWCGPCVESIPKLKTLAERYPPGRFEIISISVDFYAEEVRTFQESTPMPWTNWHMPPGSDTLETWSVNSFPTYILIDRDGTMLTRQVDWSEQLEALIDSTVRGV